MIRRPPRSTLFPYTTLFRSHFRAHLSAASLKLAGKDFPEISEYSSALDHFAAGGRAFCNSLGKRSEEHTPELQSPLHFVCPPLLVKKNEVFFSLINTMQYHS